MDLGSLRGLLAGECKQRGRGCARHTQAQVDEPRAATNARAAECAMVASDVAVAQPATAGGER